MNSIERGKAFVQGLRELAGRSAWDWRRCPHCGESLTCKWGYYTRHPWTLAGRQAVRVPRHHCERCRRTYSEQSALLVRGGWYAREVRRCTIDHWQHVGTSLRRTAEVARSWLGRQERWLLWRPLDPPPPEATRCCLSASTVHRWLDRAGKVAQQSVPGQLAGVPTSGQVGTDGLWARLRGGTKRVVLLLVDHASGVLWPPVVVEGEEADSAWERLFARARQAGVDLDALRGVTSDGAWGLLGYLQRRLDHQRCVLHLWRNLAGELARQVNAAATGLAGAAAEAARAQARTELVALLQRGFDAATEAEALAALAELAAHRLGAGVARALRKDLDAALVQLCRYNQGLLRVAPEWCWRDFRLRLSHGRNHGSP
ncbi:MAG: hypothetical protein HY690_01245, partial [Chloroflexi bacterium]|nr:hypothetical protein [Chloroflexota bacterium]